jgi:SAM-dependent methyltransferase
VSNSIGEMVGSGSFIPRALKRFVPSVIGLTHNPLGKLLLGMADVLPRTIWREFRTLPPNHLRVRVGVGKRLFTNHVIHLTRGYDLWMYALGNGYVNFESNILEIGCGAGRRTHIMRDYRFYHDGYSGKYIAVDIDSEAIRWNREHFDPRFEFVVSSQSSETYGVRNPGNSEFRAPCDDASVDFMFGTSVLTHLLEDEMAQYFREGARVLKPGKKMMMSCYCVDFPSDPCRKRFTFGHQIGNSFVENARAPESAVAYESAFLVAAAKEAGFSDVEFLHEPSTIQSMLVATQGASGSGS